MKKLIEIEASLMERIKELAEQQERAASQQIIFILKKYFRDIDKT